MSHFSIFVCFVLKNGDRLPVPVYSFCSQIFPSGVNDPSLSRPNIRLALSLPAQKVSSQTASGGGLRWRHATPGRACGRGRSRRVSSHPRFGSAVRRSYRQAEGAEVDERKINLREEGNENNTLAMAGNLKSH